MLTLRISRQMRGRAGRKGKDEIGETFLCCHGNDIAEISDLMELEIPDVGSSLVLEKKGIKRSSSITIPSTSERTAHEKLDRALMEIIAIKLATSEAAIGDFVQKTLLHHSIKHEVLNALLQSTLDDLENKKLIEKNDQTEYIATILGQAIVASSLTPEDGLFAHKELRNALGAFVSKLCVPKQKNIFIIIYLLLDEQV